MTTEAKKIKKKLTYLLLLILFSFFVLLAVTGRLAAAFGVFMAIITFGRRVFGLISILNWSKGFFKGYSNVNANKANENYQKKNSNVKTKFIDMTLDHESGELNGLVHLGKFKGSLLSDLNLDEDNIGKLSNKGIKNKDDLAELSIDELQEIIEISSDDASKMIMKAREHWFNE